MSERPNSYVGVSGVVSDEQQKHIEEYADSVGLFSSRQLALGVKAVHKTQFLDIPNKYGPEWYPVGQERFQSALQPHTKQSRSLGVAQTFFDPEYVSNPGYRNYFTNRIFERGADWIDGIQFDMLPWHSDPEMLGFLTELKQKHDTKLFLQVHKPAMEALGPKGVVNHLNQFADSIDYVLFDSSHGTGKRLDTDALKTYLGEAYSSQALQQVGIALAGGLNGEIVAEELPKVLSEFPDTSWDAEGQLHPVSVNGSMPLDMQRVEAYLRASTAVMSQN